MITGVVNSDEACIRLQVSGPRGRETVVEAVVDTGYTGALTLPSSVVDSLGLKWQSTDRGLLADGNECLIDVYEATVVWNGSQRRILVDETETAALVGMSLMRNHELVIQVRPGGRVSIAPLP